MGTWMKLMLGPQSSHWIKHDKTCELTYLEITLTEFWGESMRTQPGAPDGDPQK